MLIVNDQQLEIATYRISFNHLGQHQIKFENDSRYWVRFAGRWADLKDLKIEANLLGAEQQTRYYEVQATADPERFVTELSDYVQFGAVGVYNEETDAYETECPTLQDHLGTPEAKEGRLAQARFEKRLTLQYHRFQVETEGTRLPSGHTVETTREHQAQITTVFASLVNGVSKTVAFKGPDGWVRGASLEDVRPVVKLINDHVQQAFDAESQVDDQIAGATTEQALADLDVVTLFDDTFAA